MKNTIYLKDIFNFTVGENFTRASTTIAKEQIYSAEDMDNDLNQINAPPNYKKCNSKSFTQEGDIILALVSGKAAIVTKANVNKGLKNTMAKCELKNSQKIIDTWFFCYFINESFEFNNARLYGLIGKARVLTIKELENLKINLPPISTQKTIGRAYKNLCRLNYLNDYKKKLINVIFYETTKSITKKENKNE